MSSTNQKGNESGLEKIVDNNMNGKNWLAKKLNNPNKGLIGKIFDYTFGFAATCAAYSLIGVPALVGAGVAIGGDYLGNLWRGKKTTSAQIRDSLLFSAVLSPVGYKVLSFLNDFIDIRAPYGLIKRTISQIAILQGIVAPIANHLDYLIRLKTLNVKAAYERQFKRFFIQNIGWSSLASLVPVSLAYLGYGVDTQFYGGLAAGVAVKGLVWGKQIAVTDPYGTYNKSFGSLTPKYA